MSRLKFGIWDAFGAAEMAQGTTADIYGEHIRLAQEMERLGYHSYWVIEHQGSPIGKITSPSVFLSAIAANTTALIMLLCPGEHIRTRRGGPWATARG